MKKGGKKKEKENWEWKTSKCGSVKRNRKEDFDRIDGIEITGETV